MESRVMGKLRLQACVGLALGLMLQGGTGGIAQPAPAASSSAPAVPMTATRSALLDFKKIESASQGNGYAQAQIKVDYRFLICSNAVTLAYYFNPASIAVSPIYWASGNVVKVEKARVRPAVIEFAGTVSFGPTVVGQFDDRAVGPGPVPLNCSSPGQKIGAASDYLGPKATAVQIQAFLDALSLKPAPMTIALTDDALDKIGMPKPVEAEVPKPSLAAQLNTAQAAQASSTTSSKAMQDYLDQLQQSQQAIADFKAKRTEYESELEAARQARARYDQQFGPSPK
jgi:hypothetical protein